MAKRNREAAEPGPLQVSAAQGVRLLQKQIDIGKELPDKGGLTQNAHSSWLRMTRNMLEKAFGVGSARRPGCAFSRLGISRS
jgi:hypothetical protein